MSEELLKCLRTNKILIDLIFEEINAVKEHL